VRGGLKVSIVVLLAALTCASAAPVAMAAGVEVRPPTEEIKLELGQAGPFRVTADIQPLLGVAVIWTETGPREGARKGRPWEAIGYATRTAVGPAEGKLDVEFPGFGSIVGELVPRPNEGGGSAVFGCEGGGTMEGQEFVGAISFTGVGGSPTIDAERAKGRLERMSELRCRRGGGEGSGVGTSLFDSLELPRRVLDGAQTDTLSSKITAPGRLASFEAINRLGRDRLTLRAEAMERLGPIAIARAVELTGVSGQALEAGSKAEHPTSATVAPPAPFSGSAVYRSAGSIRSPASGELTGSLSVDLFGAKVRLAGPRAKASLINLNPGY
jgi:hypothetical protein